MVSQRAWNFYTSKELKPEGWLKRQLRLQAEGLHGNLDRVWRDVRDSAWIGGTAESWERVPYWLDGFIPLAYLLEDQDLIVRAGRYIDAILDRQKEDGWICPCSEKERGQYDTWAVQLISKVLAVYCQCSGDERAWNALYRMLKNYYDLLSSGQIHLFGWGKARWFETFMAIGLLYKRSPEDWLVELGKILREQGQDYSQIAGRWKRPLNRWTFETHIVNLTMMLKSEAVSCGILGLPYTGKADRWNDLLKQYNGTPVELFTGDECLSGLSPIQGTELCAVVEQMYSYEQLYACTGDSKWAELLETVAFNGLPAAISDDMWAHQYDQMSNQISCERFPGKAVFRTNGPDSHLFGLEPHFGCCTANFGQGWPKLALSAFLHQGDRILSGIPVPSRLRTEIRGKKVDISLKTNYPFENRFVYEVDCQEGAAFCLRIRVPSYAKEPLLNGRPVQSGTDASVEIRGKTSIAFEYQTQPVLLGRPYGLKSVRCGPLVFSLPIAYQKRKLEYERDGVERKFPYCDYEYIGQTPWNFGFSCGSFEKEERGISAVPFSSEHPPVVLKARLRQIDWGLEDGYETVCAKTPGSLRPVSEERVLDLYSYGCAKLRMTELPLLTEWGPTAKCRPNPSDL